MSDCPFHVGCGGNANACPIVLAAHAEIAAWPGRAKALRADNEARRSPVRTWRDPAKLREYRRRYLERHPERAGKNTRAERVDLRIQEAAE